MSKKVDNTEEMLEQLSGLYQKNPDKFEELRKQLITQTIEKFPAKHRKRAHGLQFKIESRLRKYKDPIVRMNKMVEIFWEQFGLFHEVLQDPARVVAERQENRKQAVVIPFRKEGSTYAQTM